MVKLWWISWWQPGEDFRILTWPPPEGVLGYWCSGERGEDNTIECSVCALIRAESEDAAWALVTAAGRWPDAGDRRFSQEHDPAKGLSDRFPAPKWSIEMGRWPW